jgi:hypothetical protein
MPNLMRLSPMVQALVHECLKAGWPLCPVRSLFLTGDRAQARIHTWKLS